VAVIAVSFGAILIRFANEAPPLSIAAWRLTLATLLLAPFAIRRRALASISRRTLLLCAVSGAFLALHFVLWIASLRYTSVASSVILVSTNPIFVALGSVVFLRERPTIRVVGAIALSLLGVTLMGWAGFAEGSTSLVGDAMAIGGAIMASGYLLAGRRVRQTLPLVRYIFLTYGTASLILLCACGAARQPLIGFSPETTVYLVLLALGPQLLGHSTFNWALRYLSASTMALVLLAEPMGSALLAYLLLGEGLTPLKAVGGGLILVAIYLGLRRENR
jgi:drug/metabolite transporter (DMT)-like permease